MLFVFIGLLIIALNLAGMGGPIATWNWELFGDLWKFTVPFIFAVIWWVWSDRSGLNKRREIARMDKRKADRREENLASLGMDQRSRRKRQGQKQPR